MARFSVYPHDRAFDGHAVVADRRDDIVNAIDLLLQES